MKMEEHVLGSLGLGVSVDIQRTDGRVHSATVSATNANAKTVTVEWFERGETKGKEIELEAIFSLNPDLAPQSQNAMPPPQSNRYYSRQQQISQPAVQQNKKELSRPRQSYLVKPPQNGDLRNNAAPPPQ